MPDMLQDEVTIYEFMIHVVVADALKEQAVQQGTTVDALVLTRLRTLIELPQQATIQLSWNEHSRTRDTEFPCYRAQFTANESTFQALGKVMGNDTSYGWTINHYLTKAAGLTPAVSRGIELSPELSEVLERRAAEENCTIEKLAERLLRSVLQL